MSLADRGAVARRGQPVSLAALARQVVDFHEAPLEDAGQAIDAQSLPRLFDRFFRADASRCCDGQQHHGLGLAIVAAIARMHAGRTLAESQGGVTRVGFTLATTAKAG